MNQIQLLYNLTENLMEISSLRNAIKEDDLNYNLYFTRKTSNNNYVSFSPNVNEDIFKVLINLMYDYLLQFEDKTVVEYNPTGYKDETIESCTISYLSDYNKILDSFDNPDFVETDVDPDDYNFYTLSITKDNINFPNIKLFRRVTKFKRLNSKGIVGRFSGNTLNRIENKLIGIDGEVDLIIIGNKIIILSHFSLERIFSLKEQFKNKASEFLRQEGLRDGITNFDCFCNDCLNDGRYRKILARMNDENINVSSLYENHENIKKTINMFDLKIRYIDDTQFSVVYENKSQIMDILRILRDSYYRSMINEEIGVDDK